MSTCYVLRDKIGVIGVTHTAAGARDLGNAWLEACHRGVTLSEGGWVDLSADKDESFLALFFHYDGWSDGRAVRRAGDIKAERRLIADQAEWPRREDK